MMRHTLAIALVAYFGAGVFATSSQADEDAVSGTDFPSLEPNKEV